MTDKQIIIDGVDVSGCEKQGETIAGITCGNGERIRLANEIITKHKLCKDNPNCVYKQLKRKEQECEKLKEAIDGLLKIQYQLADSCTKYEQTLAEIKEMLKEICMEECSFDWNKTSKKHCGDCDCRYGQILQKISEVEDANSK